MWTFYPSRIPDPGVKKAPDPGSATLVTRQAADPLNVKIQAARLDLRKNFFSVRICEKCNNLPSEIKIVLRLTTGDIWELCRPKPLTSQDGTL
jgi:hypothetical protein